MEVQKTEAHNLIEIAKACLEAVKKLINKT